MSIIVSQTERLSSLRGEKKRIRPIRKQRVCVCAAQEIVRIGPRLRVLVTLKGTNCRHRSFCPTVVTVVDRSATTATRTMAATAASCRRASLGRRNADLSPGYRQVGGGVLYDHSEERVSLGGISRGVKPSRAREHAFSEGHGRIGVGFP